MNLNHKTNSDEIKGRMLEEQKRIQKELRDCRRQLCGLAVGFILLNILGFITTSILVKLFTTNLGLSNPHWSISLGIWTIAVILYLTVRKLVLQNKNK